MARKKSPQETADLTPKFNQPVNIQQATGIQDTSKFGTIPDITPKINIPGQTTQETQKTKSAETPRFVFNSTKGLYDLYDSQGNPTGKTMTKEEVSSFNAKLKAGYQGQNEENFLMKQYLAAANMTEKQKQQQAAFTEAQPYLNKLASEVPDLGMIAPDTGEYGAALGVTGAKGLVGAAVGAGGAALLGGLGAGAAAGTALAPVTAGISIPVGAAIGGITALLTSGFSAIPSVDKNKASEANRRFLTAKAGIASLINAANKGALSPSMAVQKWNDYVEEIALAEAQLKYLTRNDLAKWSSDGEDELIKIEGYKNMLTDKRALLQLAMIKPNPNILETEGLTEDDYSTIMGE